MELVTINNGNAVTTSLAIAEGTQSEHASVIKLVRTYVTDLEEFGPLGFEIQVARMDGMGGQKREVAVLNEQQSTLLLTYMRNSEIVRKFKKALVKAFWELTRKVAQLAVPQTLPEALRLAADLAEQKARLEQQVAEQAPKVQFHDDVANSINCQTVEEVAKEFGTGRNRLFRWLREKGLLMANNDPYQRYVDQGYFKVVPKTRRDDHGEIHTWNKTLVTGKGMTYLHKLINNMPVDLPPAHP